MRGGPLQSRPHPPAQAVPHLLSGFLWAPCSLHLVLMSVPPCPHLGEALQPPEWPQRWALVVRFALGEEAEQGYTQPPGAAPLAAQTVLRHRHGSGPSLGCRGRLSAGLPSLSKAGSLAGSTGAGARRRQLRILAAEQRATGQPRSWRPRARSPAQPQGPAQEAQHPARPCPRALGLLTSSTGSGQWAVGGTRVPGAF